MAYEQIFLKLLPIFLITINVKAQTTKQYSNIITIGSSLSPNVNKTSWPSPSNLFAFGFYPQGNGFAIGIWMINQPESIIVWTANRDEPPVSSKSSFELTKGGMLLRTKKTIVYTIYISSTASSAAMLDDGNFILLNESDNVIWQSFDYPTETILVGQVLISGMPLVSSKSRADHSRGRFLLRMQGDGNLVSYPTNISAVAETSYWSSGTFGVNMMLCLDNRGSLFLQNSYGAITEHVLSNSSRAENKSIIYRATLDDDGIFRLYLHDMESNTSSIAWESLQNQCEVKGFCGLNSYCQQVINSNKSDCFCYPGFSFINPSIKSLGCYQNFSQNSCKDNIEDDHRRMSYDIITITNMWWDDHPYMVEQLEEEACCKSCRDDCNCWAVLHTSISCRKYNFPLRYGKSNKSISETAIFKMVLENNGIANRTRLLPKYSFADNKIIAVLGLSLGSVACLCLVFAISSFVVYKHRYGRYKKMLENANLGLAEDFTLQPFSYKELERATNGFKEEIGRGTFGVVYKGVLYEGNKTIAVKRLEKVVEEGVREFQAEMTTIGRTHHKNLVQLLGFCIEGSKKLLVYEFMSNGSLADCLFKAVSHPTWRERVRFIFDVARGIFYLHEECGVHIIHCNLKPQNILLDDTWTAKISDFGLARLLTPSQTKTSAGVIEGSTSIGYFAPEWHKNALISVKADIYSFGIVLLEIICCRRNIELDVSTPEEITLYNWVYKCFKKGDLDKLIVEDEEIHFPTLERVIKVGLWCVQDDPSLRPLMKDVILMLEGTMDIPVPPSPELLVLP